MNTEIGASAEDLPGDPTDYDVEDKDDSETLDLNSRAGLLDGTFIPPVAMAGPSVGTPGMSLGGGTGWTAPPVVPVLGDHGLETGRLANPFTPADPDNARAFEADIPSSSDLPSRVEAELASDGRFAASNISAVMDAGGVIVLSGSAESETAASDAEDVVRRIPGVASVVNHISVA